MIGKLETTAIDAVARVAPWLAPLPTAYLVFARTVARLAWPWWVGLAAAVVVETLGLVITLTALQLYAYNRARQAKEPHAPAGLAYILVAVYLVTAEILTVVLDIAPRWSGLDAPGRIVALSPALFPILTLAGLLTLAIRLDHAQRLAGNAAGRAERKAEAAARRAERKAEAAVTLPPPAAPRRNRGAFLAEYPGMAAMDTADIAELAGITPRAAREWKAWARNGGRSR